MRIAWIAAISLLATPNLALPTESETRFLIDCNVKTVEEREFLKSQVRYNSLDLWGSITETSMRMLATTSQVRALRKQLDCDPPINIKFIEKEIKKMTEKLLPLNPGFHEDYQSYKAILSKLTTLQSLSSKGLQVTQDQVGKSHEGRDIKVIRLMSSTSRPEKKIWVSCGQHAREWVAPAACMYMIEKFISSYGNNTRVTTMLNNYEVLVAPLINPDGYEFSRTRFRYWRKNRRQNGNGIYGVDLNRNWNSQWGPIGTSDSPTSDIYRGPSAESEPEVASTANYIRSLTGFSAGVDVHSYGQLILRNYGWTTEACPDESAFARIGDGIAENMNKINDESYVSQRSGDLYPAAGAMDDWMYFAKGKIGMTFELRDKGMFGFLLPPNFIIPTGKELTEGIITLSEKLSERASE